MTRTILSAVLVVLGFSCSATPSTSDAGFDAGNTEVLNVDVAGTVLVHPDGLGVLADAGATFALEGLTARVEEPLKVALNDPAGVFSTATLTQAATFSASQVPIDLINTGLAVGLRDESDAGTNSRIVRSATIIYDVALEAGKPSANIANAKAYAVPRVLHDKLTEAVGQTKLHQLATAADAGTLIEAGFILGRVVDATGKPVAGVTVAPLDTSKTERFVYPLADFSGLGTATSTNGLFVYIHTGGDVQPPFRFNIAGHAEYKQRSAGADAKACLVMTVYPGTTQP